MDDLSTMRTRVAYLKRQAETFRRLSKLARDEAMRAQLLELAGRCDAIAVNIEKNITIHRRFRKTVRHDSVSG
jgi:hypothetical protein